MTRHVPRGFSIDNVVDLVCIPASPADSTYGEGGFVVITVVVPGVVNLAKYDLVRVQSDQLSLRNGDEAQQVHADLHYRYNDLSKTNFIVNISYGFVQ